ncbi:hypothetical protein [Nocardia sp. NBC_01009]|nr:hypothetical protein OHA42_18310 [Nocardia sp. NBC_01009]
MSVGGKGRTVAGRSKSIDKLTDTISDLLIRKLDGQAAKPTI